MTLLLITNYALFFRASSAQTQTGDIITSIYAPNLKFKQLRNRNGGDALFRHRKLAEIARQREREREK